MNFERSPTRALRSSLFEGFTLTDFFEDFIVSSVGEQWWGFVVTLVLFAVSGIFGIKKEDDDDNDDNDVVRGIILTRIA